MSDHHNEHDQPDRRDDDALRRLLEDAVAGVQPNDRLHEIRRLTRPTPRRRWLPVVVASGLATASIVAAVVVTGLISGDEPTPAPLARPQPSPETSAMPVYFLSETQSGERLFREFQQLPVADEAGSITSALARLESRGGADDPDYSTPWPSNSFADVRVEDDRIVVVLGSQEAVDGPDGLSARTRELGVQQVVYTAEGVIGRSLPVAFEYDGEPTTTVLGIEVEESVERNRDYAVVTPISISDPAEGVVVEGDQFVARGLTTGLNSDVMWSVRPVSSGPLDPTLVPPHYGSTVGESFQADAVERDYLAWEAVIDVADLDPGTYLLVVRVRQDARSFPDRDGGAAVGHVFRDTRTFVIP